MAEQRDTKEINEFLDGAEVVLIGGKKILADGKVNAADLPHAMSLFTQMGTLNKAVQGLDQVDDELRDLSAEELQALGARLVQLYRNYKAA